MQELATAVHYCLTTHILPYWLRLEDPVRGGFYGQVTGHEQLVPDAPRGAILYGRLLWTFSAAYRILSSDRDVSPEYKQRLLAVAHRTYDYITQHFIDEDFGGVYWSLNADGSPLDTKKQFYALGFMIYGLSEYVRATGNTDALWQAIDLYRCIEKHAFDEEHNGYIEALARDWTPLSDMRLSDKDENTPKSQNTHLHILEPYTNLYRVWPNQELKDRIHNLIHLFTDTMRDPETGHIRLFFSMDWQCLSGSTWSFGHDIEASWLIDEAAHAVGENGLDSAIQSIAMAAAEGLNADGSMRHESSDPDIHWWVMAETVVGYTNLYYRLRRSANPDLQALAQQGKTNAYAAWNYISTHLVDTVHGGWYWSCLPDGTPNLTEDKVGFWKCPYHNSRMCLNIIEWTNEYDTP